MNKIKELRRKNNMTIRELVDLTGIPRSTISALENGNRLVSLEQAETIASAFGVSIDRVLGGDAIRGAESVGDALDNLLEYFIKKENYKNITDNRLMLSIFYITTIKDDDVAFVNHLLSLFSTLETLRSTGEVATIDQINSMNLSYEALLSKLDEIKKAIDENYSNLNKILLAKTKKEL